MLLLINLMVVSAQPPSRSYDKKCKEYDQYEIDYCRECNSEFYFSNGSCFPCPENCLHCFSENTCANCMIKYHINENKCEPC